MICNQMLKLFWLSNNYTLYDNSVFWMAWSTIFSPILKSTGIYVCYIKLRTGCYSVYKIVTDGHTTPPPSPPPLRNKQPFKVNQLSFRACELKIKYKYYLMFNHTALSKVTILPTAINFLLKQPYLLKITKDLFLCFTQYPL